MRRVDGSFTSDEVEMRDIAVKSLLLINKPNQVKRKKIDWIEEPVPPDHPRAMI